MHSTDFMVQVGHKVLKSRLIADEKILFIWQLYEMELIAHHTALECLNIC